MRFEFSTATRIVFGPGAINDIGSLCAGLASESGNKTRALVATNAVGPERNLVDILASQGIDILGLLAQKGIDAIPFLVPDEPSVDLIQAGVQAALKNQSNLVIGLGGGSAIDTAKAIAVLQSNPGNVLDYLEVIGKGKALTNPGVPFLAAPTTAGTGAEVTANAVIASQQHRVKVSLRSPFMLARVALVDPTLTYPLSPAVTASTGMDALTQVIEPYVSNKANPLTDSLCREGMQRAARSLLRAYHNGADATAREDMAITSLFGGMALANAKLGAVHGFAGVLGGMYHAPHGAICAALLPQVMLVNVRALSQRSPASPVLERYHEIARILTGSAVAKAADGARWVKDLANDLHIPSLGHYGINTHERQLIVEKTAVASSTKGNPIELNLPELEEILVNSL